MSSAAKPCATCPSAATCGASKDPGAPCPADAAGTPAGGCAPDKCANCPSRGSCGSSLESSENREIAAKLRSVGRVLIVLSGKGGVGKSTVATQLSYALAEQRHYHVGLMDVDICGPSIPTMTSSQHAEIHPSAYGWEPVEVTEGLSVVSVGFMLKNADDAVILRGPKKHSIISQFLREVNWHFEAAEGAAAGESPYARNVLVVDTPPGTSDEHLSVINTLTAALKILAADPTVEYKPRVTAVLVSTPQEVALADVRKEINFCKQIGLAVEGVIENMSGFVCPHCNKETQIFTPDTGGVRKMCDDYSVPYLGRIPLDPALTRASEQGVSWGTAQGASDPSTGLIMFNEIVDKLAA